jgi:hypothetical protein
MKQETLEEAAKQYAKQYALSTRHISYIGFEDGAKWQAERMYSEEDLQESFYAHNQSWIDYEGWFEQFKKK